MVSKANKYAINAKFVKSSEKFAQCPPEDKPEFAFIGRSNVGKSSLINYITNQKSLAMTSGKPGKTKTINHFIVDDKWYLVDLPGYGYAQTSKSQRKKYDQLIRDYLIKRPNLVNTFVLVDARIPPQELDLEFVNWLGMSQIPFDIVFTKADKSKKTNIDENLQSFQDMMGNTWDEFPPMHVTTAQRKEGKEELLDRIFHLNLQLGDAVKQQFKKQ